MGSPLDITTTLATTESGQQYSASSLKQAVFALTASFARRNQIRIDLRKDQDCAGLWSTFQGKLVSLRVDPNPGLFFVVAFVLISCFL